MKYKLGQLGTVYSGGTPSTKNTEFWDGDIAWITPKDLAGYSKKKISKGERNITDAGLSGSSANLIPAGSVLMSSRAPIGYVAIANNELSTNQGFKSINCDERICLNEYIYYWIKSNIEYIKSKANGSTFKEISGSSFKNLDVDVPDLETQQKIVRVLSVIDEKIELNNQQNDTLFNIIKSIFRQQFYQKGSDCSLSDYILAEINGDWGKDKKEDGTEKVYCIRGADIPDMEYGHKGNAPNRFVLEKRLEKKSLSEDDIIIEISGGSPTQSTGRTAYITQEIIDMYDAPLLCTNFCKAIKVKDRIFAPFIYMYLKLLYEDDILFNWENGTTGIKNLALSSLLFNTRVQSFGEKEVKRFYNQFYSIVNKISKNSAKNMNLVQMHDTLLPKLMSDKIDLGNVNLWV